MLRLRGITKRFAGVVALENVDLDLNEAEVLAIIGENGAGKSTLMKVIGGVHQPDEGTIELEGKTVRFKSPNESLDSGIRVIYQELSSLDNLTIAGNIFLGFEKRRGPFINDRLMNAEAEKILSRVGLDLDARTLVSELSLAQKQLVEIARALVFKVRVLILDEPTSSLTFEESRNLFRLVHELKAEGVSIVYISHRLEEVKDLADRVVGLRDGKNAGSLSKSEVTHDAMVRMMVGRDLFEAARTETKPGEACLTLRNFCSRRFSQEPINLEIRAGEVLGMAGLVGSGRSELATGVFGIDEYEGELLLHGNPIKIRTPQDAIKLGIYLVPEDRKGAGITVELTIRENVSLPNLSKLANFGWIKSKSEQQFSADGADRLGVKRASIEQTVGSLSGGNQQKVVLARWLMLNPQVLIVDEPTRGVDVGAKAEIYAELRRLGSEGLAIWMISSDMEEILNVSDRIAVLHEGRMMGVLDRKDATEESVMKLAVGGKA